VTTLQLTPEQQDMLRVRTSCAAFAQRVLGYTNASFHEEWYNLLVPRDEEEKRRWLLLLAPRGHGKSECLSITYPAWLLGKTRNLRIIIASKTTTQSELFVGKIARIFESNAEFRRCFGRMKPETRDTWNDHALIVDRPNKEIKDPSLLSVGVGSAIPSRRADLIICDDLIDDENCSTELQRDKVEQWFWKTLVPVMEPHGRVIMIGTRWHYDDLYARVMPHFPMVKLYQALQGETPLWPAKFSREWLGEQKARQGAIVFNCQYMNDPSGMKGLLFDTSWLKYYDLPPLVEDMKIYFGVDPATSERKSADKSAIVVIGIAAEKIYLLHYNAKQRSLPDFLKALQFEFEQWRPEVIAFEATGFQKGVAQQVLSDTLLPIKLITPLKDKVSRIRALSPYFESGKLLIGRAMPEFEEEYVRFPRGQFDDLLDALATAMEVAVTGNFTQRLEALKELSHAPIFA
jgi:predicted phage terminase large subunit-like protein